MNELFINILGLKVYVLGGSLGGALLLFYLIMKFWKSKFPLYVLDGFKFLGLLFMMIVGMKVWGWLVLGIGGWEDVFLIKKGVLLEGALFGLMFGCWLEGRNEENYKRVGDIVLAAFYPAAALVFLGFHYSGRLLGPFINVDWFDFLSRGESGIEYLPIGILAATFLMVVGIVFNLILGKVKEGRIFSSGTFLLGVLLLVINYWGVGLEDMKLVGVEPKVLGGIFLMALGLWKVWKFNFSHAALVKGE